MALDPALSNLLDGVSGFLVIALGIVVFAIRPTRTANRAFLLYAAGFGLAVVLVNLVPTQEYTGARFVWAITGICAAAGGAGILWLAHLHTRGISNGRRVLAAVPAAAYMAAVIYWDIRFGLPDLGRMGGVAESLVLWYGHWYVVGINVVVASTLYYMGLAALAPDQGPTGERNAIASSLWVDPAMVIGVLQTTTPDLRLFVMFIYAGGCLAALAWLAYRRERPRTGRNMALWILGLPAFFGVMADWRGPAIYDEYAMYGLARLLLVSMIAYSILRHQILGMDVKVRWTLSRGTIAAVFIAVFFVVSELAAELIGGTGAGPIAGILGAGALVFFLAPLQRWADRLAGAATGDAKPVAQQTNDERLAAYRATAASAWADGAIDGKERALLDTLRTSLGLSFEDAGRIESEVAA